MKRSICTGVAAVAFLTGSVVNAGYAFEAHIEAERADAMADVYTMYGDTETVAIYDDNADKYERTRNIHLGLGGTLLVSTGLMGIAAIGMRQSEEAETQTTPTQAE